jgi:hypothetical protein
MYLGPEGLAPAFRHPGPVSPIWSVHFLIIFQLPLPS